MSELIFLDFETRSPVDLPKHGMDVYAAHPDTDALCLGWIKDDFDCIWSDDFYFDQDNDDLEPLFEHVRNGGYLVAWNARFDRKIWNEVCVPEYGWPEAPIDQWLCAQAQGEANNLPAKLEKAAECLNVKNKKSAKGKSLIGALSYGTRGEWGAVFNRRELMQGMRDYCMDDNRAMLDIWNACRPLLATEWAEYHASERVNDRGVAVDVEFAKAAEAYAADEKDDINAELLAITGEDITITHHQRKAAWLHEALALAPDLQKICEKPVKGRDEDGNPKPPKKSADRPTREAILEIIDNEPYPKILGNDRRDSVVGFLEAIEAGNSAAVYKFRAISNGNLGGRLFGQYSFNGAGQTGRFSGRGVQVHNLIRAAVDKNNPDKEIEAIEAISHGTGADQLVETFGLPISRLLARLLRPTFVAPEGKMLVWADWDQIEARVLPWLSNSPGGREVLAAFERGEDIYVKAAAGIFNKAEADVTDGERQIGKVAVLALGFGGGAGAFRAMARGYGLILEDEEIDKIVKAWRESNPWARQFWNDINDAVYGAYRNPMIWYKAGRVEYLFHPELMYGTLICKLPCGRWLVYPQFKEITYTEELDDGTEVERTSLSFVKGFSGGYARVKCWYGTFAENVTQAYAASHLRRCIKELDDEGEYVVLHTHDEIVLEVTDTGSAIDYYMWKLKKLMERPVSHSEGLPLSATVEYGPYYTKAQFKEN